VCVCVCEGGGRAHSYDLEKKKKEKDQPFNKLLQLCLVSTSELIGLLTP